jgi:signal transduction histidine kinase
MATMIDRTPGDSSLEAPDESPGAVYRRRGAGSQRVVAASDGVATLTGHDPGDLTDGASGDRGWLALVHPDDRASLREAAADASPGKYREETYRIRTADGDVRWVRDRFVVVGNSETESDDGPTLEGAVFDVTETVQRRQDLEADSDLLDALFDQIPIHVYVKDREARHVRISNYMDFPEDVIGKRDIDVGFINQESAQRAYEDDMRVIEDGETILDQEQYYPAVDEWDLNSKVPLYSDDGEVLGLLGATRRITERKRTQQELRRKTERLEKFADIVAQDIRATLNEALDHAERIDDVETDEEAMRAADEALTRAEEVIDDVLALSREDALDVDPRRVPLSDVARETWQTVQTPDVSVALPDDSVVVDADRELLAHVFENLFRDADERGSSSPRSTPSHEDAAERSSASPCSVSPREDDKAVTVSVELIDGGEAADADGFAVAYGGVTIPPEERDQVFDPAYAVGGPGSGLALAMVEEIVDAHGWSVEVTDRERGASTAHDESETSARSGVRFEITGVDLTTAEE